jgi:hypothetical protein
VATLREPGPATGSSDVDVNHQLLSELAGGNRLPVVPLPDILLTGAHPDGLAGKK